MKRKAFTLLELLVVITIIGLLISILLPVLAAIRESGREIKCQGSSLHSFGQGLSAFALDHQSYLPGVYTWSENGLAPWQRDWLSGTYGAVKDQMSVWNNAPDSGTLFEYVGENRQVYLCPSLRPSQLNSGLGSNGKYDYTMLGGFGGARLDHIDPIIFDSITLTQFNPVPFFVEENPEWNLNRFQLAGSLAGSDRFNTQHFGNSSYSAIDGSVQKVPKAVSGMSALRLKMYYRNHEINVGVDPDRWNWLASQ